MSGFSIHPNQRQIECKVGLCTYSKSSYLGEEWEIFSHISSPLYCTNTIVLVHYCTAHHLTSLHCNMPVASYLAVVHSLQNLSVLLAFCGHVGGS